MSQFWNVRIHPNRKSRGNVIPISAILDRWLTMYGKRTPELIGLSF
jgi:hypothetical protein